MGEIIASASTSPTRRRSWRNGLVAPGYQISLTALFSLHALLLTALFLGINFLWATPLVRQILPTDPLSTSTPHGLAQIATDLLGQVSAMVLLYLSLCIVLGAYLSHRTAGPMYRLRIALGELESGSLTTCSFRTKDEVQDLAIAFNQMVDALRASRTMLDEAHSKGGIASREQKKKERRTVRGLWIEPRLQARYVTFGAISGLVMVLFYFAFMNHLMRGTLSTVLANYTVEESHALAFLADVESFLIQSFAASLIALLISVSAAIVFSHRTAGPIHRIRACFLAVARGDQGVRCHLRRGDHLEAVAEAFNRAMEAHELRSGLPASGPSADSPAPRSASPQAPETQAPETQAPDPSRDSET